MSIKQQMKEIGKCILGGLATALFWIVVGWSYFWMGGS